MAWVKKELSTITVTYTWCLVLEQTKLYATHTAVNPQWAGKHPPAAQPRYEYIQYSTSSATSWINKHLLNPICEWYYQSIGTCSFQSSSFGNEEYENEQGNGNFQIWIISARISVVAIATQWYGLHEPALTSTNHAAGLFLCTYGLGKPQSIFFM